MGKALKRSLSLLLAVTIILGSAYAGIGEIDWANVFGVSAKAASSGTCGDSLTWNLDDAGTLTISGIGDMYRYAYNDEGYMFVDTPWYESSYIKKVVVNSGVTSIGDYAFYDCESLTSIIIPDSVTSIGNNAFEYCTSLKSVTIPDSVTSIGEYAFEGCTSLVSITIPDGVTSISVRAFSGCESLKSVTIPDSVTSIGDYAFIGCKSLPSITIPDGVTYIGDFAFYYCSSLTSITIPDGVKSLGASSFFYCKSLTTIKIPDSVTSIGSGAFAGCTSLKKIYYSGSKAEWEALSVGSNNAALENTNIVFDCKIENSSLKSREISLSFKVLDNETKLNNETVIINGKEYDTGKGTISFTRSDLKDINTISVESTISDFYEETFKLEYLDSAQETIFLEKKKSNTRPYINYVYYKNITSGSDWKNAVNEGCSILDTSEEKFDIAIGATTQVGEIEKIFLAQDGANKIDVTNGKVSGKQLAKEFIPDKDIIAYCIDTKGNISSAFKTGIEIENADENVVSVLVDGEYQLFSTSGTTFEISEDVPFLGGTEIGLDFANLPISVSYEASKFKIAIGVDDKTFTKDEWNLYKKKLDAIDAMQESFLEGGQKCSELNKLRKELKQKAIKGTAVGEPSFDWTILGYVELDLAGDELVVTDSYVGLSVDAGYSWTTPFLLGGFPCYYEVGVGISGSFGGKASRVVADNDVPIEWEIILSIKPRVTLGVGAGIPAFLSLGIEGKGEIEWYQQFLEMYYRIALTLSASIKAKAFLLSFDKEIASKTWVLREGPYGSGSFNSMSDTGEQYYSSGSVDFFDSKNYSVLSVGDYKNEWIGGYSPAMFSSRAISVSGYNNSFLQYDIYSDSRQQLVEFDGGKMLIWITYDKTRDEANRTKLVYSLHDESTATWSAPVAICDDGTADFLPDVVSDGNNVWVVWQNMNTTFTEDTATMENYSAASEIYVAKYNSEIGAFENAIQVTDDSVVDSMPAITAENGNVSVAWVNNSENDYFGLTGVNSINTVTISNDKLEDIKTVETDLTSISSIDCKLSDNNLYIAYAYDVDNDYNDMSDMEVYQLKVSNDDVTKSRISENAVLDSAPRYSEIGGKSALVWYSEGNFNTLSLASNEVSTVFTNSVGATDMYSVAQSAGGITYIIWSQSVGEQVAFYGAVYDGSEWGEPVLLGEATGKTLNPSAIVDADGTMFVAYNNVVQEQVTDIIEETGEEFTYYTDVQTDLALLKVYQNSNISLSDEDLKIDAESAFPGETIPLTFGVKNNGTTAVDNINIFVDGELNSDVQVSLLPGQETSIAINYTVPETVTETTLSITAEPVGSADYDMEDNEISITYGYTELDVTDVTACSTALWNTVNARICNTSAVESGAFTVRIRENDEYGVVVCTERFDNIPVGEAVVVSMDFKKSTMDYNEDGVSKYYVEVEADNKEYGTCSNSGLAVFIEEDKSGITSELLEESVNDSFVHAYGVIQNNEFAEHDVYAKIEVLDENGDVIGLKFKKVSLSDKQTYTLDENVHISGEYYETRLTLMDLGTGDISLRIPKGVTTIDELDFENCPDIVKLIIPDSVTTIGANAFSGCSNLTVFCFPNSAAHNYCEYNSIPYVLYKMNPIGETAIDSTQKFIFTSNLGCSSFDSIVTATGYEIKASPVNNMLLFGTGSTVEVLEDEENTENYTLVVKYDTNGDGVVDALDAAQVALVSNGLKTFDGAYGLAADTNLDEIIDIDDYQAIVNKVVA